MNSFQILSINPRLLSWGNSNSLPVSWALALTTFETAREESLSYFGCIKLYAVDTYELGSYKLAVHIDQEKSV